VKEIFKEGENMNKQKNKILINDTADVGIGTLIIFIAMVLVAAVAAAVLIQTSGILQQKAQQTGKEAATEVTSNINIVSIIGNLNSSASPKVLENFSIAVQLSAGGQNIDFQSVVMKYIDNQTSDTMNYNTSIIANITNSMFNYTEQRSIGTENKVLSPGEIGIITIKPTHGLGLREKGLVQIVPETGTMVSKEVIGPSTWGTKSFIQLFP